MEKVVLSWCLVFGLPVVAIRSDLLLLVLPILDEEFDLLKGYVLDSLRRVRLGHRYR